MSRAFYLAQGIAAGMLFGTSSIIIRFLPTLDAITIGFYRLIIAITMLIPINILLLRETPRFLSENLPRLIMLGLLIGFHFIFFISAVKYTTILNTTVLVNTTPVITLVLSWIFLREPTSTHRIIGLVLTLVGASSIALLETIYSPGNLIGDLFAFLAAVFWAVYLMLGKPIRERGNVLVMMPVIYSISAILLALSGFVVNSSIPIPSYKELIFLLALAFLPTVLGHTLHFSSLKHLSAFQTSTLALLEPVVATILAAVIFLEIPNAFFYIGAAVTMLGIYLVLR
ncbi:MAG TPA: DMT family transporter [Candidatus Caldiarchaeum subterraneum]|uniref:DMT family transporter n=1 Tax=Caldiarchaeum subterraneum TaxID=311458 RepID=A0A833EBU4_CALS0|nr:DMT family transporter [Candidatus Caldarchaeum subterraneum]